MCARTRRTLAYLEAEFETDLPCYQTRDPAIGQSSPPIPSPAAVPEGNAVDFSLTAVSPEEEADRGKPPPGEELPYTLELPENFEAIEEFKSLLTEQAQSAGKYVFGVISAVQEAEQRNIATSTQELRNDWGKDFQANRQAVKRFSGKIMAKPGLTPEDMAPPCKVRRGITCSMP